MGAAVMLEGHRKRRRRCDGARRHHGRFQDGRDLRRRLRRRRLVMEDVGRAGDDRRTDGGDHGDLHGDRTGGEGSDAPAGRDGRGAGHRRGGAAARGGRRGGARRAGAARTDLGQSELEQNRLLQQQDRAEREDRCERAVVRAELRAESAATIAVLDMAANRCRQRGDPLGGRAELEADLVAGQLAGFGSLGEADAGTDQQRLDARHRRVHHVRDLLIRQRVHLAQHECRTLRLRQMPDVLDEQAELLPLVDLLARRLPGVGKMRVHRVHADRRVAPQVVQRAVARNAIEPRPCVDLARVGEDRVERGREDLLEDVLGVLARAEHVAAERQQPRLVARDQRFERRLLAAAGQLDQPLVAREPKQGRRSA